MDETLDVLAAHGIAGFTGILFIGFFAQVSWNGVSDGLLFGNAGQLVDQALAAVATPAYAFVATYLLLRAIGAVMPLRGSEREEALGMDLVHHGEEAYARARARSWSRPKRGSRWRRWSPTRASRAPALGSPSVPDLTHPAAGATG